MTSEDLFAELVQLGQAQKRPPIERWHPENAGCIDIRIDAQGQWFHEGTPFKRQAIVRAFSGLLRFEENDYWLVTPAEKLRIQVDDAPFLAVDFEIQTRSGQQLVLFRTNVNDAVLLDADHAIWLDGEAHSIPYIHVRDGLNAKVTRAAFYRLVEVCIESDCITEDPLTQKKRLFAESAGRRFDLGGID